MVHFSRKLTPPTTTTMAPAKKKKKLSFGTSTWILNIATRRVIVCGAAESILSTVVTWRNLFDCIRKSHLMFNRFSLCLWAFPLHNTCVTISSPRALSKGPSGWIRNDVSSENVQLIFFFSLFACTTILYAEHGKLEWLWSALLWKMRY